MPRSLTARALPMLSIYAIIPMKSKHLSTLHAVFKRPTQGGIVFADIEALILALGADVREGAGSRVAFELHGSRRYLHQPHPGKEARKYQVEELRAWFTELGVEP
ncbi:type II toxin-antitoxin system HicA family toxin [Paraburkholderia sp. IW21]|uniref:type II toxin-antitoxin system HicA family toxin n=1 Tax=Paraburkholderia sp. IW21 TaxID=3242488 RepID=UPI00352056A7